MNDNFKELARWTGIIGTISIITGVLQAIAGVFSFVVGAIPGIISIIMGVKLLNVKKYAREVSVFDVQDPSNQVSYIISNLSSYFKIQGILLIITLVFQILNVVK